MTLPPKVICGRLSIFYNLKEYCTAIFIINCVMSKHAVYQCIQQFDASRVTTKDVSRPGRRRNSFNDDTIACVCTLLDEHYRYTVIDSHCEMATHFLNDASRSTVYCVLTEALEMRKVCTRWVPRGSCPMFIEAVVWRWL